jgi:hypothetical protein
MPVARTAWRAPRADVDAQAEGAERWQPGGRRLRVAQPLGAVASEEGGDRRLMKGRDLQIPIRQIATTLVHEDLAVQAVVEWAELGSDQCLIDPAYVLGVYQDADLSPREWQYVGQTNAQAVYEL